MTSPIGLSGTFAEFAILLVLLAALASPRVSQLGRLLISTFAFICAWLLAAELAALGAPDSTMFMAAGAIAVNIVVIIVMLHIWTQIGEGGESDPRRRGGPGGGGPRRPRPAPQPGGGGNDPSWWPEFERQLAFYLAERDGAVKTREHSLCGKLC